MSNSSQISCAGFVIAGGKSSRMGTTKALLQFQGQTMLARALATLGSVSNSITIVGDPATFAAFGPVIPDQFPGCGPLAGIHAALAWSSAEQNIILAVDMPFITPEFLCFLLAKSAMKDAGEAVVTIARTARGFQPLCAIYRRDFAQIAGQALRAGNYKIDAAFASVPTRIVEESELAANGFSEKNFFNINTPEDRRTADGLASAM
jgi:molybdenum cofactor guanylyltransferase